LREILILFPDPEKTFFIAELNLSVAFTLSLLVLDQTTERGQTV